MKYLIKYSPEMTIKSRVVRNRFCKQLRNNLRKIFQRMSLEISVEATWDNMEVTLPENSTANPEQIEEVMLNTPGINSFHRVKKYPFENFDQAFQLTLQLYEERLVGKTFAVRCKRTGRHDFTSVDIERYIGGGLCEHTDARGVSLSHPEITVALEIRHQELFIVDEKFIGLGGYPLGSQEGVLSLISGGFDSSVSSYLSIKRGLRTHFLFFNLGGQAHELAVKEVALYLWMKYGSSHNVLFISVPFEDVVTEILEKVDNSQMGVVLKRMMLRAADSIAEEFKIEALVTGESVAQVSSQTLANLALIDKVSDTLVFRPLIMSDKQEIVDIARRIGTEQFSAVIPEYCGVISVRPTTKAREHKILAQEERFDFSVLERAVTNKVACGIAHVQLEIDGASAADRAEIEPEIVAEPGPGQVIIDIRHPDDEERFPLILNESAKNPLLKIPFYKLSKAFPELEQEKTYLLYCDKGIMSRLHASHLKQQGFRHVGVYRPG